MIIFLNGTSSSGKTTLAHELRSKLSEPYFYLSLDHFLSPSMPLRIDMSREEDLKLVDSSITGFNQALYAYSKSIGHIIVDHVLQKKEWLMQVADSIGHTDVFFVCVTAPLEVVEKREKLRPDRLPGTARSQYEAIHQQQYDMVINTHELNPQEAAIKIITNLKAGSSLKASLAHLRSSSELV